jgi:hypothetical protein
MVKETVELYLYSPPALPWPVLGAIFTFTGHEDPHHAIQYSERL